MKLDSNEESIEMSDLNHYPNALALVIHGATGANIAGIPYLRANGSNPPFWDACPYSSFQTILGQGATGATGASFTGATGASFTGATGASFTGATGASFTGATGASFTGATGASFTGATGASFTGATGAAGAGSLTHIAIGVPSVGLGYSGPGYILNTSGGPCAISVDNFACTLDADASLWVASALPFSSGLAEVTWFQAS